MICGGEAFRTVLTDARDLIWRKPGAFTIQTCAGCGLTMTRPRPATESLGFFYDSAYSGDGDDLMKSFQTESRGGQLIFQYRLRVLNRIRALGPADHLLDVGCSYGGFLRVARVASGCAVSGIDLDEGSIAEAVDADQTDYRVGELIDGVFPAESFSVVTFYESLEHHARPVEALATAHRMLAPGGLCVVEVPNFDGFWRRVFRTFWLPLMVPQHLVHFTPRTLRGALEAAGFSCIEHQQTMFFPLEGVASLGMLISRLTRSPPLGAKPSWRTPFDLLVFLLLLVLYVIFGIPSQALLHGLGISGHHVAVARKEAAPRSDSGAELGDRQNDSE